MSLAKAQLIELSRDFKDEKPDGQRFEVQFNPESLKVTFANELKGGDQGAGTAGRQFVGAGTTKLALQLWFDVTAMEQEPVDDVRRLTQKVIFFMTPQKFDQNPNKLVAPPGVRFLWGSFKFDGMVDALEETLEFFSPEGRPLRASIALTLSQQKILEATFEDDGRVPKRAGQQPLSAARQGESLQRMAAMSGAGDWQSIAAANRIEDPLRLPAGKLVNLSARADGASPGPSGTAAVTVAPRVQVSFGGLPRGASGSLTFN